MSRWCSKTVSSCWARWSASSESTAEGDLGRALQPGHPVTYLHAADAAGDGHTDRDALCPALAGDRSRRGHPGATRHGLPHPALPDPHRYAVVADGNELDVGALGEVRLKRAPHQIDVYRRRVVDQPHRMGIAHVDQPVGIAVDVNLLADAGRSQLGVDGVVLHDHPPYTVRGVHGESPLRSPAPVIGITGHAAKAIATHLGSTPVCVPVVHAYPVVIGRHQHPVRTYSEAAVPESGPIVGAGLDRAFDDPEGVG